MPPKPWAITMTGRGSFVCGRYSQARQVASSDTNSTSRRVVIGCSFGMWSARAWVPSDRHGSRLGVLGVGRGLLDFANESLCGAVAYQRGVRQRVEHTVEQDVGDPAARYNDPGRPLGDAGGYCLGHLLGLDGLAQERRVGGGAEAGDGVISAERGAGDVGVDPARVEDPGRGTGSGELDTQRATELFDTGFRHRVRSIDGAICIRINRRRDEDIAAVGDDLG